MDSLPALTLRSNDPRSVASRAPLDVVAPPRLRRIRRCLCRRYHAEITRRSVLIRRGLAAGRSSAPKWAAVAARIAGRTEEENAIRDDYNSVRLDPSRLIGIGRDDSLASVPDLADSANQSKRAPPRMVADLIRRFLPFARMLRWSRLTIKNFAGHKSSLRDLVFTKKHGHERENSKQHVYY